MKKVVLILYISTFRPILGTKRCFEFLVVPSIESAKMGKVDFREQKLACMLARTCLEIVVFCYLHSVIS